MSKPIPVRLREEFVAYMDAADNDDLPDGAWFALLEEQAERFIKRNGLRWADANDAVFQYLDLRKVPEQKS